MKILGIPHKKLLQSSVHIHDFCDVSTLHSNPVVFYSPVAPSPSPSVLAHSGQGNMGGPGTTAGTNAGTSAGVGRADCVVSTPQLQVRQC